MVLHRLNRTEYHNAVFDLFEVDSALSSELSPDGVAGGFDNNAEALQLGAADLDVYLRSAASLAQSLVDPKQPAGARWLTCSLEGDTGGTCARTTAAKLAARAWRRPLLDGELDDLMAVAQKGGGDATTQLRLAAQMVMLSPYFLYRVEIDPPEARAAPHPLGAYELASRLSFFLWSTLPDDTLLAAAADGSLSGQAGLADQTARMLADPRARALVDNFFGQWFWLRQAEAAQPDPATYPGMSGTLQADMVAESRAFFSDLLQRNAPIADVVVASYTFVTDDLASYYGVPAPHASTPSRVDSPKHRRGALTQGGLLLATSLPTRTSAVLRGKFVLSQLLCRTPPPPPANVPALPAADPNAVTDRQRLDAHVSLPSCAGCHGVIDPLGYAFGHFDGVGQWRDLDHGQPIDTSGKMPDGTAFDDVGAMAAVIAADPHFSDCVLRQMFAYALGRPLEDSDAASFTALAGKLPADIGLRDLVQAIVLSPSFRGRQGDSA